MSRCFPYPPTGYESKSAAIDEPLINSIKLQKEKKKGKKERNNEKKMEKKQRSGVEEKKLKHEKRHMNERNKIAHAGGDHQRRYEAEQFEKSDLTEEHEHSQNLLDDSSDSTQNNHKRKGHCSPSSSNHKHGGSILRIRFKHRDHEILPTKTFPCSNSGKADYALQENYEIPPRLCQEQLNSSSGRQQQCSMSGRAYCGDQERLKQDNQEMFCSRDPTHLELLNAASTLEAKPEISPRLSKVQTCSTSERASVVPKGRCENDPRPIEGQTCSMSGRIGVQPPDLDESAQRSSSKLKKRASKYRDLIENWVPSIIEDSLTDAAAADDDEWLFGTQSKSGREAKRLKPSNGVFQGSCGLWQRACYLPDSDMHVLPYTVPF